MASWYVCFTMLPFVFDHLRETTDNRSIVICVSPLMMDQRRFSDIGLTVDFVGEMQEDEKALMAIYEGRCQVVYICPEKLIINLRWREMLRSKVYHHNLVAFIVDEVHTVKKW